MYSSLYNSDHSCVNRKDSKYVYSQKCQNNLEYRNK